MTATKLPDRIHQQLIDNGTITLTGLSRKARARDCLRCGLPCIAGLDGHLAALDAWCDPTPLTLDGELEALIAGLHTYTLWGDELAARDHWIITSDHTKPLKRTILAEHRCETPVPQAWAADAPALGIKPVANDSQEVPF